MVFGPGGPASSPHGSLVPDVQHFLEQPHLPTNLPGVSVFLQSFLLRVLMLCGGEPTDLPGHEHHGVKVLDGKKGHNTHEDASLFKEEDLVPWTVFTGVFFILVIFDNGVLHRKAEKLSLLQSLLYTTFWIACAGGFCLYVFHTRGLEDALQWGTGYVLEWMLSLDNLFVFHRIFEVFKTPDEQKHKPLFYGIIGAIVFRMGFFLIGEIMMKHVWWIYLVFGAFLVYTGIKIVAMEEEEESPEQGWLFLFLVKHINYVDRYDDEGRFFTPVEVNQDTNSFVVDKEALSNGVDGAEAEVVVKYRATRLLLVVVCLEVTDLIFAIDSVSAIVAQIPDLFLAYTACVFAMLGLRALFFAIDELVKIFSLLCYGVAFILIFLGLKLMLKQYIHFPPKVVCCILLGTLFASIVASLVKEKMTQDEDEEDPEMEKPSRMNSARSNDSRLKGSSSPRLNDGSRSARSNDGQRSARSQQASVR